MKFWGIFLGLAMSGFWALPTFAQESTAVRAYSKASNVEVQVEQTEKIIEMLEEHSRKVTQCADESELYNGSPCLNPEEDTATFPHAKRVMAHCSGLNEVPFWNGTEWICKTLVIPVDCQVSVNVLGQCVATGTVRDGSSQTVSCSGSYGVCSASVSCSDGNASASAKNCTPPANCPGVVVGGAGCTTPQNISHNSPRSWFCDAGYSGTCASSCDNGTPTAGINACNYIPRNCYDDVSGAGCSGNLVSLNHGQTRSWSCDAGYTGSCSATCNDGSFSGSSNNCSVAYTGEWSVSWSACSGTCGGGSGTQTATITCPSGGCDPATRPTQTTRSCVNNESCAPSTGDWTLGAWGAWSACSVTCGTGTQTRSRSVSCNYDICAGGMPATNESQSCTQPACVVHTHSWQVGSWSGCSATCGNGTQTRSVICRRSDGATVADGNCAGAKPAVSQACSNAAGCTYAFQYGAWNACSVTCGGGTQTRTALCRRSDGTTVANSFCGSPVTSQSCNSHVCPPPAGSCQIAHPIGWYGGRGMMGQMMHCIEYYAPIGSGARYSTLGSGQTRSFSAGFCASGSCHGSISVTCTNGSVRFHSEVCRDGLEP